VSGESLVLILFAAWVVTTGAVLVPAFLTKRTEELPGPVVGGPAFLQDFVEAVARGDFETAEQAAAGVFDAGPGILIRSVES
jgi:hypothetical protein